METVKQEHKKADKKADKPESQPQQAQGNGEKKKIRRPRKPVRIFYGKVAEFVGRKAVEEFLNGPDAPSGTLGRDFHIVKGGDLLVPKTRQMLESR